MKVLVSAVVAVTAFLASVLALPQQPSGSGPRLPPPMMPPHMMMQPSMDEPPKEAVKLAMMLSCMCNSSFSNCKQIDTFFSCLKDDLLYLGNISEMDPCDVKMKMKENTKSCFGPSGSLREQVNMCQQKMFEKKKAMMADRTAMAAMMDKCRPTNGTSTSTK